MEDEDTKNDEGAKQKKRILPAWMLGGPVTPRRKTPVKRLKRNKNLEKKNVSQTPAGTVVYCLNEAELVESALSILNEVAKSKWKNDESGDIVAPEAESSEKIHVSESDLESEQDNSDQETSVLKCVEHSAAELQDKKQRKHPTEILCPGLNSLKVNQSLHESVDFTRNERKADHDDDDDDDDDAMKLVREIFFS
ncbi:cell cycle regulator of non-homologous end joining [Protopterus annectens]|uniref:cell cycle regulator of non-homologous end joining n=1 Tax=Protopterus annectens TaxID=7888 RepID=UPI001CFB5D9B|nr:cell cycle regulator of non-homologous end joining [Protopterus annectens]